MNLADQKEQDYRSILMVGWATAAAIQLEQALPLTKDQLFDYLDKLGVQNPEQYWTPGLTMTDGKVDQ